jgi:hypothetical protein
MLSFCLCRTEPSSDFVGVRRVVAAGRRWWDEQVSLHVRLAVVRPVFVGRRPRSRARLVTWPAALERSRFGRWESRGRGLVSRGDAYCCPVLAQDSTGVLQVAGERSLRVRATRYPVVVWALPRYAIPNARCDFTLWKDFFFSLYCCFHAHYGSNWSCPVRSCLMCLFGVP